MKDMESLAEKTPREVENALRIQLLFGSQIGSFSWMWLCFSMFFFWVFAIDSGLVQDLAFIGEELEAPGVIVGSSWTGAEMGDEAVIAYTFAYEVNGRHYEAVGYEEEGMWMQDDRVLVYYRPNDPGRAYVEGLRTGKFGGAPVLLVTLFVLPGLWFVWSAHRRGSEVIHLMAEGTIAHGRLVGRKETGLEINECPQYAFTFSFECPEGKTHEIVHKTTDVESLTDDLKEPLLYSPSNPSFGTMLDALPGSPIVDPRTGGFKSDTPERSMSSLFLPIVTVLGHGGYAAWFLLS